VSGFFKIKTLLIWMLVASPAVGYWVKRGREIAPAAPAAGNFAYQGAAPQERIAIEVVTQGTGHETVYVDVAPQAVPEPSSSLLVVLAGALAVLRRGR